MDRKTVPKFERFSPSYEDETESVDKSLVFRWIDGYKNLEYFEDDLNEIRRIQDFVTSNEDLNVDSWTCTVYAKQA